MKTGVIMCRFNLSSVPCPKLTNLGRLTWDGFKALFSMVFFAIRPKLKNTLGTTWDRWGTWDGNDWTAKEKRMDEG